MQQHQLPACESTKMLFLRNFSYKSVFLAPKMMHILHFQLRDAHKVNCLFNFTIKIRQQTRVERVRNLWDDITFLITLHYVL